MLLQVMDYLVGRDRTEGIMFWIVIRKLRIKFERRVSQFDSSLV